MTGSRPDAGDAIVTSDDAPRPGDVLAGKYRVESVLGVGGMGVVLLVEHIELAQRMAIKLMTPGVNHDPQAVTRFLREARAAAGLHSEHVVRIFDVGTLESGAPFMVMELLRGEDLGQLLTNVGRLEIKDAVDYVLQACHAIAEAHASGVVHRDLKPSNLFLTRRSDGTPLVKVLDFGISKAMNPTGGAQFNLTATSAIMGSPLYMSPEQVRDAKQVDERADIWSLGVILHELLTGAPAFQADTLPGICAAIIADPPLPLRSLREDAPSELEAVVARCLEKDVRTRFQSTRDLMLALRSFASTGMRLNAASIPAALTMKEAGISSRTPEPSSAVPSRAQFSRVDATQADSMPAGMSARSAASASLATSAVPIAPGSTSVGGGAPRSRSMLLIGVLGVGILAAAGAFVAGRRDAKPELPTAAAPAPVAAATARKSFVLMIDSTPSGAQVREGDRVLGNTPMQLSIDNEVVRTEPRRLTVVRESYQTYSILQGPSDENVRIIAPLVMQSAEAVPAPPSTGAQAAHPAHAAKPTKPIPTADHTAAPAAPPPPPPPAPTPPPGDIRMQR